jgi:hypothetical protein
MKVRPLNQEVDTWVRAMRVSGVDEKTIDLVVLKYFEWTVEARKRHCDEETRR